MWKDVLDYLHALWKHWIVLVSGVGSVILGVVNAYLKSRAPYWPFWVVALVCFFVASYRAWSLLRKQNAVEVAALRAEIERLKQRPYDAAHRKLVEGKLQKVTATGTDILRFLLHHGRIEIEELRRKSQAGSSFDDQLRVLSDEDLVRRDLVPNVGRAGVSVICYVNPEFTEVLKDLLY